MRRRNFDSSEKKYKNMVFLNDTREKTSFNFIFMKPFGDKNRAFRS